VALGISKGRAAFIFKGSRSMDVEHEGGTFLRNAESHLTQQCTVTYQKTEILLTIILKYPVKLIMERKTQSLAGMKRIA
jgi:hypothetical protein